MYRSAIALSRTLRILFQAKFKENPCLCLMEMVRFELMTPCLQGRCSPN